MCMLGSQKIERCGCVCVGYVDVYLDVDTERCGCVCVYGCGC